MGAPPIDALAAAYAAGCATHPDLRVDVAAWRVEVKRRIGERLTSLRLVPSPERCDEWLRRAAQGDLFLAVACGLRAPGAWERLVGILEPRLIGLAHARGVRGNEAETLAGDVLGDFLLPGSISDPRPLLASYAGTGSLFGFAAVLLGRREARRRRDPRVRRRVPLSTCDGGGVRREKGGARAPAPGAPGPSPAESAADADVAAHLAAALSAALNQLTPRERLALVLKHRDGRPQREIAALLAVGEPRVSRLLTAAVERLRAALVERLGATSEEATSAGVWMRLRDALAVRLAGIDTPEVPPPGSRSDEGQA